jgi:hypothetical protein
MTSLTPHTIRIAMSAVQLLTRGGKAITQEAMAETIGASALPIGGAEAVLEWEAWVRSCLRARHHAERWYYSYRLRLVR